MENLTIILSFTLLIIAMVTVAIVTPFILFKVLFILSAVVATYFMIDTVAYDPIIK